MNRTAWVAALSAAVGMAQLPNAEPAAARTIDLADLRSIVGVGTPQISPDGSKIAVVTSRKDFTKDRTDSELMLVDVKTGAMRPLTYDRKNIQNVRWSPDGKSIGFLALAGSGDDAAFQVWVMPMAGGDAQTITKAKNGVDEFAWRPDGKAIAFVADDDAPNKKQIDAHLDAFEVGDNDYTATSVPASSQLWTIASAGGVAKRLTKGSWQISQLSWSPDGRSIAAAVQHSLYSGDADQSMIEVFDAKSGAAHALTGRSTLEGSPLYSPDGTEIAYGFEPGGTIAHESHAFVSPETGGLGKDMTSRIDREISPLAWTPDGIALLVAGDDGVHSSLWAAGIDGSVHKAPLGDISFYDGTISKKTGMLAILGGEPERPAEVYVLGPTDSRPRRLTDFNRRIASLDLGEVKPFAWTSDGFSADGILTMPPKSVHAGSKPPLVVLIHGGPTSESLLSFDSGYGGLAQVFAARGWMVFEPNYRGSDGLGKRYMEATIGDLGAGPGRDIVAGVQALERAGMVDPSHIFVGGWSEGGCLTSWLITHYTIWKAVMAGAPVTDWIAEDNLSDALSYERAIAGEAGPWSDAGRKLYAAESAISAVASVKTPTLLMDDTGDYRVPTPETYAFYHALHDEGVEVQYVIFPAHAHFPRDPVRGEEIYKRWIAWYADHLR
ncbi:MAG TPA: S9 family peptidase [Candidatus Eremiobacteraceae bacterium]|nr:S9 family peptidase [Candidatus Eremiobacteraceae bacterium]